MHVKTKLNFIPPAFNPLMLQLVHLSLPILRRVRLQPWLPAGISTIETVNVETLVNLYHQFQIGKIRLILAFRHCEVDDPLCGLYLLSQAVPSLARQEGIPLQYPIHSHFMYDRGMPLWAGSWLGWVFSRMGGIPVHRGKPFDWLAIRTAREILINGKFPLAVAPEGATNGHSEIVSILEPGTAQLGFWCVEDLLKANRVEQVIILPIGIQYKYVQPQWGKLDRLLSQLESDCGLAAQKQVSDVPETNCYQKLLRLGDCLLTEMEEFYRRFYHCQIPEITDNNSSCEDKITIRLQALLNIALQVGEEYFGLSGKGTVIERCRRLEEASWNYIYRQDVSDLKTLSPLQKGLADWIAQEANLRSLHMRLVESFVAVTGNYIREKPSFERFAETTLIIFDLVARIKQIKVPRRPRLGWRSARVTIGNPISVSDRYFTYHQNRQAAKKAISQLTQDLQVALEGMID